MRRASVLSTTSISASSPAGDGSFARSLSDSSQPPINQGIAPRFAPGASKTAGLYPSTGTAAGPARGLDELRRKLAAEAIFVAAIGSAIKEHIADCWRYRKLY